MVGASSDPAGQDHNACPDGSITPRHRVLDSALWVAGATAFFYLAGNSYLNSYYHSLGLMGTQIHLEIPFILERSLIPLLYPVVFIVVIIALAARLPPWDEQASRWNPVHPWRLGEVVSIVSMIWVVKALADLVSPDVGITLLAWGLRDLSFVVVGFGILSVRYALYWLGRAPPKARKVQESTWFNLSSFTLMSLVVVVFSIFLGRWALPVWSTVVLIGGFAWIGLGLWRDIRTWPKRRDEPSSGPPKPREEITFRHDFRLNLHLYVFSLLMLVLASGIQGTLAADAQLDGCEPINTVTFSQTPNGLNSTGPYWLVLHQDHQFFIRDLPPEGEVLHIIPQEVGQTVATQRTTIRDCKQ